MKISFKYKCELYIFKDLKRAEPGFEIFLGIGYPPLWLPVTQLTRPFFHETSTKKEPESLQ